MDTKSSKTHSPFLSSTSNRSPKRKNNNECNSPEFEFWMLRNPSLPQPNILSADQLFLNGVILPLHLISTKPDPKPDSSPAITDDSTTTTISKRWRNFFGKKNNNTEEKVKKKEKRVGKGGGGDSSSAELYINIWPFSRSRSAKNSATGAPVTRKVNSAPCSRSNSDGDAKSMKFPSSPGRAGVHVGRSSPVWKARRGGKNTEALYMKTDKFKRETTTSFHRRRIGSAAVGGGGGNGKAQVLNLNVPICVGYNHNKLGCKIEDNSGGKLFHLRNFFTKKTVLTSH